MSDAQVNWYKHRVTAALEKATDQILDQLAMQTLGQARINIRENRQIDTGFMTNSGYVISAKRDEHDKTWPTGEYPQNPEHHGGTAGVSHAVRAEKVQVDTSEQSAVAFAAHYAIYQEMRKGFLFPAMVDVIKYFGGIVRKAEF